MPTATTTSAASVLKTLKSLGKPNTVKIYARYGVTGDCYGVSYAELYKLQKKHKGDQTLALELWKSGNHDGRILATLIVDPTRLSKSEIEGWLRDATNPAISAAIASIVWRHPEALPLALKWIGKKSDWVGNAGWNVLAFLALQGTIEPQQGRDLLTQIEARIHRAPNWTRYAMNSALIALGSIPALRAEAIQAAKAIGAVDVDHGETGCKTPDAVSAIEKGKRRKPC